MDRRTPLPTNAAALATLGDVVLAGALLDAAWADYRAGRMALDEVFRWQRIHRIALGHYVRLVAGGLDDGSDFRAGDRDRVGLPADGSPGVDRPALVEECAHAPMIPPTGAGVNTSEGP